MQYDKLFKLPDLISSSVQWGNTINLTGLLRQLNKMIYIMYLAQCLTCHTVLFIHCQHARAQAGTRKRNCSVRTNGTGGRTKNPLESQSLFLFGNYKLAENDIHKPFLPTTPLVRGSAYLTTQTHCVRLRM